MQCVSCNQILNINSEFCTKCGTQVNRYGLNSHHNLDPNDEFSLGYSIGFAIVGIIMLVIIFLVWVVIAGSYLFDTQGEISFAEFIAVNIVFVLLTFGAILIIQLHYKKIGATVKGNNITVRSLFKKTYTFTFEEITNVDRFQSSHQRNLGTEIWFTITIKNKQRWNARQRHTNIERFVTKLEQKVPHLCSWIELPKHNLDSFSNSELRTNRQTTVTKVDPLKHEGIIDAFKNQNKKATEIDITLPIVSLIFGFFLLLLFLVGVISQSEMETASSVIVLSLAAIFIIGSIAYLRVLLRKRKLAKERETNKEEMTKSNRFCTSCGFQVSSESNFCSTCGKTDAL